MYFINRKRTHTSGYKSRPQVAEDLSLGTQCFFPCYVKLISFVIASSGSVATFSVSCRSIGGVLWPRIVTGGVTLKRYYTFVFSSV